MVMASGKSQLLAELSYLESPEDRAFTYMYDPVDGNSQGNCSYVSKPVAIQNARLLETPPDLEQEGFELLKSPSDVSDFWNGNEVRKDYYPEIVELLAKVTGGREVYVFDHMLRRREVGRPPMTFGRHGDGSRAGAAGRVHNDYSEQSGRDKLALVIGDITKRTDVRRYSIINVWRPVNHPVRDTPLALCDARTVATLDLVPCEVRRPDRTGEIYLTRFSPRHQWFYYDQMTPSEVLLIKQFDSQLSGISRMTPHAAFDMPDIPEGTPLRESIETRCLVVY